MNELIEQLADAEHASWAAWMDYLFRKCQMNEDGTATIPAWAVENWQRQARTPYAELSELEKEGDRDEVRKIVPVIEQHTAELRAEVLRLAGHALQQVEVRT